MNTVLIILGVLVIGAAVYFYFYKTGKINDSDGDYIPDEVEDAIEDAKNVTKEVKRRAKAVKEELADVLEEASDVASAFQGKVTKTKLRQLTKKELFAHAEKDFGKKFESNITKSNLINQVYSLHHNK
tara:strand:+ start:540 stop:923 length:384 start_codon:yes stop_codon:yes gene_type:complete